MPKYSILTCIFSNYEMVREVQEPNPEIEYILVTDNPDLKSETWKILYYPQLLDYPEGPDRWAYVRYHPFEFVNTDICLYIDGSIQIKTDPIEMLDYFASMPWEYGTLQNTIVNDIRSEVNRWAYYGYYRFTQNDANRVIEFLDNAGYSASGLLQSTIILYKNTEFTRSINNHTWTTMFLWGHDGHVDRINQTALTYAISKISWHDNRFILMHPRFLWSKWFEYCYHNSPISQKEGFSSFVNMSKNLKNDEFEFQNIKVSPWIPEIEGEKFDIKEIKDRRDLIFYLIDKFGYKKYLEIGVCDGYCYNKIHINKTGIDPDIKTPANLHITSDEFFANNNEKFDIIFIDGLHQCEQVYKDIINSLNVLNPGGTIICHDMWPETEERASHENPGPGIWWNGDCYKALLQIAGERDDLLIHVLYDLDEGTTIIRKTINNPILKRDISNRDINVNEWHSKAFQYGLAMSIQDYIQKSEEIVICAIAKQEEDFLEDWCKHHLDIGFDRIYLYINDDDHNIDYDWIHDKFGNSVEIRYVLGLKSQQYIQYRSFYDDNIFRWVMYLDIDEYLRFSPESYSNIKEFINKFPDADAFAFQWKCFRANPSNKIIDVPVENYCTEYLPNSIRKDTRPEGINGWYKSIVKSGRLIGMNEHQVWPEDGNPFVYKNCLGNNIQVLELKHMDHSQDDVWVDHYICKNIKEFYYNKYLRGHAGLDMKRTDGYTWWNWNQNLNYFSDLQWPLSSEEQLFISSKGYKPNWIFRPRAQIICHKEPVSLMDYGNYKQSLIGNILENTDSVFLICSDINAGEDLVDCYGGTNFFSSEWYHNGWFSAWMPYLYKYETFGQPEIIIFLGYPDTNITPSVLNPLLSGKENIRDLLSKIIENPDTMIISNQSVKIDKDCGGYAEIVHKFISSRGYMYRDMRIKNHTFITSRQVYDRIYKLWGEFINECGPIYDAWVYVIPSLVNELKLV